ncbi:DUF6357 family protein [Aeromicrobium sp. UC242_57]|uniref:DUF6357 family protein n=1 Tax=Aeromicrobium sp. UC242_57 TaxID=3374624 RepID=UPI0037997D12
MTSSTHIVQSNGMSRGPLIDSIRPYPEAIRFSLNRMNGTSFWAYSLWRAPDDADLLADIPLSDEYVQCAGTAAAMTVEVRTVDPDGTAHQFTVGKPGADHAAGRTEMIRWDGDRSSTTVHLHEVFTADEAADVFYSYFLTNEVSAPYVLRELDLTMPSPAAEAPADRVRELTFSDDDENEQTWRPSSQDGQQSAADAFWEFVSEHSRDDNASFCIEDDQNSEALLVMLGAQTICRARSEPSTRTEYSIVTNDGTYGTLVQNFVRGGFAALDRHGPWWPDVPSLLRARLRLELDESPLRRTHPRGCVVAWRS